MSTSRLAKLTILFAVVAAAIAVGTVGVVQGPESVTPLGFRDFFVLAVAAGLGTRLMLPRARGRATSMAIAVVACVALLTQDPRMVAAIAAASWGTQAVRSLRSERSARLGSLGTGAVLAWGLAGLAAVTSTLTLPGGWNTIGASDLHVAPVAVVWAALVLGAPALEALEIALNADRGRRARYRDLVRSAAQTNTVLAATATLGALAYPELGSPTVLLMALPLLAAKLGFDRNTETRTTYDQTLRAMSRLPEQLGAVDPGHGVRAGEVAAIAATDLGMAAEVVTDIERAAQLHELGRIRTEDGLDLTPEEIANGGAAIVTEAGALDRVAQLIAAHRGPVPVGEETAWVGGALVRLACDLDLRLTARGGARVLEPADRSWIRAQGVQPRMAEAVIHAAEVFYAPTPA